MFHFSRKFLKRLLCFFKQVIQSSKKQICIFQENCTPAGNKFQKTLTHLIHLLIGKIWDNRNFFHLIGGKLGFHIKFSNTFDFITKKLNAKGFVMAKRKNINNPSANRKLSRFRNKIYAIEFIFK